MIGDRALGMLERGAGIVADVARNGISAITGRIAEFTSGLVDTVLGGIRDWVTNSVVGAAITRLLSMFNPAGAVIQAIIAVYNTIRFFIERAQQLGALANSIFTPSPPSPPAASAAPSTRSSKPSAGPSPWSSASSPG